MTRYMNGLMIAPSTAEPGLMKIAVYQIADAGDPDLNIAKAYEKIVNTDADFFALPEFFTMPGGDNRRPYTLQSALN